MEVRVQKCLLDMEKAGKGAEEDRRVEVGGVSSRVEGVGGWVRGVRGVAGVYSSTRLEHRNCRSGRRMEGM